jgi:hypothetical protein
MTRINAFRSMKHNDFLTWGKNASTLVFAAVLIICSVTVGCSSDKPKPISSNNQIPVTEPKLAPAPMPAPVVVADSKPAPKKAVHKKPVTVNYTDKATGVTFEYPRRYAIETGDAATHLLLSSPIPMNFVQPGGVALAAVELPETGFTNTDFSSAFFNVSINKSLSADQCTEFAVPQPKNVEKTEAKSEPAPSTPVSAEVTKSDAQPSPSQTNDQPSATTSASSAVTNASTDQSNAKLLLGDLELRATEAVSGEGARQSDSKYFHVFQNGSCYEFALNVTTEASDQGVTKHVDRDKVFTRLEQILSTVKINPVAAPEVTADAPVPAPVQETPAQK